MSAPNFRCNTNSRYIYAFCEHGDFEKYVKENAEGWGIEDDDQMSDALNDSGLYRDWEEDEKEYYLEWLREELAKTTKGDGMAADFTEEKACEVSDGDEVATVRRFFDFAGGRFMVEASIDFEAGYYEGFALDWNIKAIEGCNSYWHSSVDSLPDADGCAEMLRDETELNNGLCKALAAKLANRIKNELNTATEAIEKALQTVSPYHLTGCCACNGEGIYTNHAA